MHTDYPVLPYLRKWSRYFEGLYHDRQEKLFLSWNIRILGDNERDVFRILIPSAFNSQRHVIKPGKIIEESVGIFSNGTNYRCFRSEGRPQPLGKTLNLGPGQVSIHPCQEKVRGRVLVTVMKVWMIWIKKFTFQEISNHEHAKARNQEPPSDGIQPRNSLLPNSKGFRRKISPVAFISQSLD